jgi:phage shock protein C
MTTKRLHRDNETAIVAGVLSGMAEYFKQDPVLFRLAAIVLIVLTGVFPGLLLYLVAWVVMPRKPKQTADYTIVD